MTDRDKKVLAAVLALLVVGGFWFLVISPKRAAVTEAQTRKDQAQAAVDTAMAAEAAAKSVKVAKPLSYAKLVRLGTAVPADSDFESLLVQLNDASNSSDAQMVNLAMSGAADSGATGSTSSSTCDAGGASGATGAAPAATPATGASGSTSQTWVGKSRDKAQDAAAATNANQSSKENTSVELSCNAAPTLADLSAQAAGLKSYTYTLTFKGSFFDLDGLLTKILDMVKVHNGRVNVTGRLLDIKQMTYSVETFPTLNANIELTGYSMPVGGAPAAAPAADPAAGAAPAAATTPSE